MALTTCKECDGKVSTLAKTCPHCGITKPAIKVNKKSRKTVKPWGDLMDIMCANVHCTAWLNPVNVPKKKLSFYKCPRCNQGMKMYSERVAEDDYKRIKNKETIKANQSNIQSRTINNNTNSSSSERNNSAWDKFLDGKLDLAAAFWGFGVFGSLIVGLICGFLTESVGSFFIFVYIVATITIISGLWQCADTHKKNMTAQKQSTVWGILTQAYCVLGGLGLINFIFEYFK